MSDHRPALLIAHHPSLDLLDQDALDRIGEVAEILDREPLGDWNDPRADDLLARAEVILGHWGCAPLDAAVIDRAPNLGLFAYAAGTVKQTVSPDVFDRDIRVDVGRRRQRRAGRRVHARHDPVREQGRVLAARRPAHAA